MEWPSYSGLDDNWNLVKRDDSVGLALILYTL